jgi:solute carrier family 41
MAWQIENAHHFTDNITPPLAACLGDLITLFILALLGAALVGLMDTPIPLLAVIGMSAAAAWFTRRVMRDEWVRNVAKGGWAPLVSAILHTVASFSLLLNCLSWA